MAGLTRRAGGWTFSSQKNSLLIKHSEDKTRKTFDKNTIQRLVKAVNSCCVSDTSTLLSLLPPLDRVVAGLPSTLPIVEALYTKCEQYFQLGLFVSDSLAICVLKAEEVFCRIVWWMAYCEQEEVVGRSGRLGTMPSIQSMENSVSHILQLISRQFPSLVSRAAADKRQLEVCLESLGCHGLVNCSQGLIRLHEASRTEIGNHEEKLKKSLASLKELVEKTTNYNLAEDPSSASHQRQMSRRLSEIFDRLKFNEGMEKLLQTASTNHHLNSLLRISRKRVASDRLLIGLFHAFNRAAPSDFRIDQLDPVIAELIVIFNNTYDKVLQLSNFHEFDSGCSTESTSEKGTCMPKHLSEVSTSSPDPLSLYANEHIYDTTEEVSIVKEKHVVSRLSHAKSTSHLDTLDCEGMRRFDHMTRSDNGKQDETLRLRLHIEHLKNELSNAREQVEHLTQKSAERTERLWPEPDYPEATNFYNCSSQTDVKNLINRFSNLFHGDRSELTDVLNSLPEFPGSEELQLKTLLSVVVLAYRSVSESVQKRIATIWDVIEEGENRTESEEANMLDLALFRHIYRKAKSQHGMQNAKEVTSQIWKTLYDFPSLKTCTRFNRFVLECVDVSWDLVAGIDGRYPRMLLDYEASLFDQGKHTRTRDSNPLSSVIRTFIWPGLVDQKTGRVLLRAVVAT